jgi:putative transcription factor
MTVCSHCQKLGKPYVDDSPPRPPGSSFRTLPGLSQLNIRKNAPRAPELPKGMEDVEILDDYAARVRKGRMKLGLSQEDLANRVKEKLSLIQKIETGKMTPSLRLCRELEHELRVKLLTPRSEIDDVKVPKPKPAADVTLGDIVHVKGNAKDLPG